MVSTPNKKLQRGVIDPYEVIFGEVSALKAGLATETDPEKCQASIRQIDEIQKKIADLQARTGLCRKEAGQHVQNLRKAKPKGKPQEGEVRTFPQGGTYIFTSGSWYPLGSQEPEEK
jgi:hypothetical protein